MQSLRETEIQSVVPFNELRNFRDLGGYPTGVGLTRQGRFYRAPGLHGMTEADRARLLTLGVRCIVDLRTPGEVERAPDPFGAADGVHCYNLPLIDSLHSGDAAMANLTLLELYTLLVDKRQAGLAEVFATFARHVDEGACVFHCTAGKDRTGIVAALLLMLAGVPEEDIVHNYAATAVLMRDVFAQRMLWADKTGLPLNQVLFGSDAATMQQFIDYFKAHHGAAADYLSSAGLSQGEIGTLKRALTQ